MSEEIRALEDSLHQYETQLEQINQTILISNSASQKNELSSLRDDIQHLIELTRENLNELKDEQKSEPQVNVTASMADDDDPFAKEYALFKAELGEAVTSPRENDENNSIDSSILPDISEELQSLQGSKCQAPFTQAWGTSYHNALVFHVEPAENITGMEQIQVRVMFTNPTDKKMIPCPYYLEGECRFGDKKCRFSHGELVYFSQLKEYKEPNFKSIKAGSRVLVLNEKDKLWHRAIVQHEVKDSIWEVRLETSGGGKIAVNLKDLLPLEGENDEEKNRTDSSSDISEDEEECSDDNDVNEDLEQKAAIVQLSLMKAPSSALGSWEKHTRGIGSKLMEKMGYITGSGLGPAGDGRVEPVEAVVFPPGKSLDHCMKLKAEANGDNLLKTDKKLRRLKKKQLEQQNAKYEREKKQVNVFDFINSKLGDCAAEKQSSSSNSKRDNSNALKNESNHNLNLANLQVGEDIRKAEKDLAHLKESLKRQAVGTLAYSTIANKVSGMEKQIHGLKESERRINVEQNQRKGKQKISVF